VNLADLATGQPRFTGKHQYSNTFAFLAATTTIASFQNVPVGASVGALVGDVGAIVGTVIRHDNGNDT